MNQDDRYGNNINDDMERLFPRCISDESAVVLCDFLAELLMVADTRYLCHLMRYRKAHSPPVDPQYPWRKTNID